MAQPLTSPIQTQFSVSDEYKRRPPQRRFSSTLIGLDERTSPAVDVRQNIHITSSNSYSDLQKEKFTKWVNMQLRNVVKQQGGTFSELSDVSKDFRDGKLLISLLPALYPDDPKSRLKPERGNTRHHHVANVTKVLSFLETKLDDKSRIALKNVGPVDIIDGNIKLTLGLIWAMISKFRALPIIFDERILEVEVEQMPEEVFVEEPSFIENISAITSVITETVVQETKKQEVIVENVVNVQGVVEEESMSDKNENIPKIPDILMENTATPHSVKLDTNVVEQIIVSPTLLSPISDSSSDNVIKEKIIEESKVIVISPEQQYVSPPITPKDEEKPVEFMDLPSLPPVNTTLKKISSHPEVLLEPPSPKTVASDRKTSSSLQRRHTLGRTENILSRIPQRQRALSPTKSVVSTRSSRRHSPSPNRSQCSSRTQSPASTTSVRSSRTVVSDNGFSSSARRVKKTLTTLDLSKSKGAVASPFTPKTPRTFIKPATWLPRVALLDHNRVKKHCCLSAHELEPSFHDHGKRKANRNKRHSYSHYNHHHDDHICE